MSSTRWAVIDPGPPPTVFDYDDEEEARAHLPYYRPGAYLARCEVTQTPWERVS